MRRRRLKNFIVDHAAVIPFLLMTYPFETLSFPTRFKARGGRTQRRKGKSEKKRRIGKTLMVNIEKKMSVVIPFLLMIYFPKIFFCPTRFEARGRRTQKTRRKEKS